MLRAAWGARRTVTVLACTVLLASMIGASSADAARGTMADPDRTVAVASTLRLAGSDRYNTAILVSRHGWTTSQYVVVATGENYPDALSGAPLAHAYGAPILLTKSASLPPAVASEIRRLKARNVIILGGTVSVKPAVETALKGIVGSSRVERIAGADRFDCARRIALRVRAKAGNGGRVVVVNGMAYPDALAVAGFAAQKRYPLLLVRPTELPGYTANALSSLGATSTLVVGRTTAVSAAVYARLPGPQRIYGSNDYDTARVVAEYAAQRGSSFSKVVIASSYSFADPLAAGALVARLGGVYLLTNSATLSTPARDALNAHLSEISEVHILGGTVSFKAAVEGSLKTLLAQKVTVPWSAKRPVGRAVDFYLRDLDAEVGPDGALAFVYSDSAVLWLRKLDAKGNTLISPVMLPATPLQPGGTAESYPSIAVAPDDGRITIVWRNSSTDTDLRGVWALQYDKYGRHIRGPLRITSGAVRFLDIACDSVGDIHLTGRGETYQPAYARYTKDLQVRTGTGGVSMMSRSYFTRCEAIAVRPTGIAELVWFDSRDFPTYGKYQVYHSRLAWGASGLLPPGSGTIDQARITSITGGISAAESAGSNFSGWSFPIGTNVGADGSVHLGWMNSKDDVYYERLNAAGLVSLGPIRIADYPAYSSDMLPMVDVAARTDGGADLVFPRNDTSVAAVRLAHAIVAPNGTLTMAPTRIASLDSRPEFFSVERNGSNLQMVFGQNVGTFEKLYYADTLRDAIAFATTRCDLVVDDAHSANVGWPREGQTATMSVRVANHGWSESPTSAAVWKYAGAPYATITVPPLAVDATVTITATWTVPANFHVVEPTMTVSVDATNAIPENSETNNTAYHGLPVHVRPPDRGVVFWPYDETVDASHTDRWTAPDHIKATLAGTRSETPTGAAWSQTVEHVDAAGPGWFTHVPPGSYQLSYSATGYAAPYSPIAVTVSRQTTDPYRIDVSPAEPIETWVNTWGTLDGVLKRDNGTPGDPGDDVALSGATIRIDQSGLTTVTAADGSFAFHRQPAGNFTLSIQKDGWARLHGIPATVTVGGHAGAQLLTHATSKAYVDVFVYSDYLTPLPGATASIHTGAHSVYGTATTVVGGDGRASFEVTAGLTAHANASRTGYLSTDSGSWSLAAGREYTAFIGLDPDPAVMDRVSTDWETWSPFQEYFRIEDKESTTSYRNFKARFAVDYVDDVDGRTVVGVHSYAQGLEFLREDLKIPVEWEVFGYPIKLFDAEPRISTVDTSNVWIRAVKLVDSSDGSVLYDSGAIEPLVRSGTASGGIAAANPEPWVLVDNWSDLEVWTWYTIEKVDVVGEWETSPLGGRGDNGMVLIYKPSAGVVRAEPWLFDP